MSQASSNIANLRANADEARRLARNEASRKSKAKAKAKAAWAAHEAALKVHMSNMYDAILTWRNASESNEALYQQALCEGYSYEDSNDPLANMKELEALAEARWERSYGEQLSDAGMQEMAYDWAMGQGLRSRLGLD